MKGYPEFSELLNKYLNNRNLTGAWLARQLGFKDRSTVTKWLNNVGRPGKPEVIAEIVRILDLNEGEMERLFTAARYIYRSSSGMPDNQREEMTTKSNLDQKLLSGLPKSYVPSQHYEPFLNFYEEFIEELYRKFFTTGSDIHRIFVLHGPHGMGKSKIAHRVAIKLLELKEQDIFVVFHPIDHIAESKDASDALNPLIERISTCLDISTTESIVAQQNKIKNSIQEHNYKLELILDGLRNEIEPAFINFLEALPDSTKVLITHNNEIKCKHRQQEYKSFQLRGIEKINISGFLGACWPETQVSTNDIEKINVKTKGNSFALRQIARSLKENPSQKLDDILNFITDPDGNIAYQWIGETYKDLSPEAKSLLNAHSLFRDTVDGRILVAIAELDLTEPSKRLEVQKTFEELCKLEVFSLAEKPGRFRMEEPYRTYVREIIERNPEERKEWKNRWVKYYRSLRPREPKFHDSVGWTSFADYFPDGPDQVSYVDEIETIIDVVKYCISPNHVDEYWRIAADILYSFRTTLFATGKWDARIELCKQVLQEAERREQNYITGQLKRMLAWIYCFKDDYDLSEELTKSAKQIAYNGIQDKNIEVDERIIYRQTYNKALNTLGNIALRRGYDAIIRGQKIIRELNDIEDRLSPRYITLSDKAQLGFQQARTLFEEARDWFLRSDGFVGAEFPKETLITNFYIAQVGYYNRNFYGLSVEKENEYVLESLNKSYNLFLKLLNDSKERKHERLITHVHYYLGKIYRRLARYLNDEVREEYFSKSFTHLEEALQRAQEYGDFVLIARIEFARGQWYENKLQFAQDETEKNRYLREARIRVQKAAIDLTKLGMVIESMDAVAFLKHRLWAVDIPDELLVAYETRYKAIIAD